MFLRTCLSLLSLAACLCADEAYSIRLARPLKAGDRFEVSAKMALDDSTVTIIDGGEAADDKTVVACRLTGSLTVDAVTTKGQPMDVRLKLKSIECVNDGQPAQFFKAGDELRLRHGKPDNVSEVNGEPAEELQSEIIEAILSVQGEGEVTDDDVFGTADKVKVGAEWPVTPKAAIMDLEAEGVTGLKPEHIKGSTKIAGATEVGNQPALLIRAESKIDGKGIGLSKLPESVKATRFYLEMTGEMDVPVDLQSKDGRAKGLSRLEVDAAGKLEEEGVETSI